MSRTANAAQAQRWNGESGRYWVAHRERHLAGHRYLVPHLFGAAAISAGERVLDVGCGCGATTIAAAQAARGTAGTGPLARQPSGSEAGSCRWPGSVRADAGRRAVAGRAGRCRERRIRARRRPGLPAARGVLRRDDQQLRVMFFDDPAAAFANMAAALRRRGRLAFLCWQHDMHNEVFAIPLRPSAPTRGCRAQPPATSSLSRGRSPSCYRAQAGKVSRSTRSASRPGWDPTSPT